MEIKGNLIAAGDFEGLAGFEVLENYDASFLSGDKSKKVIAELEFSTRVDIILQFFLKGFCNK